MTETETLSALLVEIGLTRNEALAYLTLLADDGGQGLTGYEVAARSGIPRSVVYTTLAKLEGHGAAFQWGDKPARFVATDPRAFVQALQQLQRTRLDSLKEALGALPKRARPQPVWILSSYLEVLERAEQLICSAERSVYTSLWPREIERLRPALEEAAGRGLHAVLHCPTPLARPLAGFSCWIDDREPADAKHNWSHKAVLVIDRRFALVGGTEPDADNQAVSSGNPSIVDVATNHLILDITLMSRETGRDCAADVAPMMRPYLGSLGAGGASSVGSTVK
jgi:sugar-specific transcriptional regulator TrmB